MRFEWDEAKSETNLDERGFDFAFASLIFDGLTVEVEDRRRDYGEPRVVAALSQRAGAAVMSERSTRKRTPESRRPSRGRADLSRLRRVTDAEIRRTSPPELTDLPADFWIEAEVVAPTPKRAVSIRLDEDVLDWFRRSGPRYQTRMNAVLRMYVKRMRKHAQ